MKKFSPETAAGASAHCLRSAGFQTCRIADFQIGNAPKLQRHLNYFRFTDLEIRDTADLEVGATEGRCADAPPTAVAAPLLGCSEANRNPFLCQKFWMKGETSGHLQHVTDIAFDCDGDTLLIQVEQTGAACHEGYKSCFFRSAQNKGRTFKVTESPLATPERIYGKK